MKVIKMKLTALHHPQRNLRLHTDVQLREFRRSVEMFGQIRPIVIDEDGVILAGNGLYDALVSMDYVDADCCIVEGLSEAQKKKLMLADNRIFDLGVDDMATFDSFILELKDDLDVPGFDENLLQSLVMDSAEVDGLISDYGIVPQSQVEEIRDNREKYIARDKVAAVKAAERTPVVPDAVREEAGYAAPFKSEENVGEYVICPKCGERIWL